MKKINRIILFLIAFFCIVLTTLFFTIYLNYYKQKRIIIQSHLDLEMNFIKETGRVSKLWFDKRIKENNATIDKIEQEIFVNFIDPISILKSGDAWIYNRDYVVFDKSSDFPDMYRGKSIREIFSIQKKNGAYHYDDIINAVENAGEGTGWYVWLPDKGKEWAAWTSFTFHDKTWTLGLSTPEDEILNAYNMDTFWTKQVIFAFLIMFTLFVLSVYIVMYYKKQNILITELDNANNILKNLNRMKNDFIVNIAHDFRAPLTIISSLTELNLMHPRNLPVDVVDDFSVINKTSVKFLSKINKLLELARIETAGPRLRIMKMKMREFIDEIYFYYTSALKYTGIKVEIKFPEKGISEFYTDVEMTEEIMDNLLSNAVKFVDFNSGRITIELNETGSEAIIKVTDNGLGINKDELNVIFGRFEQGKNSYEIKYQGSGIGLSYSKLLTKILGGSLEAYSPGKDMGSTFIVKLSKTKFTKDDADKFKDERITKPKRPLLDLRPEGFPNEMVHLPDTNKQNEFNPLKGIILIADDDRYVRDIIIRYLRSEGYVNFISVADGKRGLELFNKYHPDMVITDYNMPNMKGDEFYSAVMSNTDNSLIPFIFISAIADEKIALERKKKGISDFLFKPINGEELAASVNIHMKKYQNFIKMTAVDELTKFSNRSFFLKSMQHMLLKKSDSDFSVILFDLDHFKQINDTYGHQAGDYVLSSVCGLVLTMIRTNDIAGRYGGEEFIIVLPDTNAEHARIVADKIRSAIESMELVYENLHVRITASFGISSLVQYKIIKENSESDSPVDELIKMADSALYAAKSVKCPSCSFIADRHSVFNGTDCPLCGHKLMRDRNRVEIFNGKELTIK